MIQSHYVQINRFHTGPRFAEIKDPCVQQLPDGSFFMMASIGNSPVQKWRIGRFTAQHPAGPWNELPMAEVHGLEGFDICAPAFSVSERNGRTHYKMYVQNSCFGKNGVIALAESEDGHNFFTDTKWQLKHRHVPRAGLPIVGLYDAGLSDIEYQGKEYECLTFSGFRKVGCGDLYVAMRAKDDPRAKWSKARLILKQEDVPFHNKPLSKNFEWGLEGAKIVQLSKDNYMLIGACFLEEKTQVGERQRVFMAAAESPFGPFEHMALPLNPIEYNTGQGENGHPDTIDLGDRIGILFQERAGDIYSPFAGDYNGDVKPGYNWHLRYAEESKSRISEIIRAASRVPELVLM